MKRIFCTAVFLFMSICTRSAVAQEKPVEAPKPAETPKVEVVFCLDTTGSMGGLINAAKQKVWAICSQISTAKPTPIVKVGLVGYRDRRDAYVTQVHDLSEDLDSIHAKLMKFQAGGGGDFPESVNQALHEAVTKITWSTDKKTLRIIFLVGDAPPHMDYADDVKYADTCKLAVTKDIVINTVQCGSHAETRKYWQEICRLAEGSYVQLDSQGGPVVAIATPFDADLAKINRELSATTLGFGSESRQEEAKASAAGGAALAPAAAADRAGFLARNKGSTSYDLLTNIRDGKVQLEKLDKAELPEQLRGLTLEKQREYLKDLETKRNDLSRKALDLDKKRNAFITKKQAEDSTNRARDSFDNQVLRVLQTQANRQNVIRFENVEEKK